MKAVVLAGGEGTRLRPLTASQPKPMLPIVNRPMMEHVLRLLGEHGFDDVVVTVAFLADQVRSYFGDGSELGVNVSYAVEESPLGTAGSVGNARELLDDTFLVIAGDALTDIDLSEVVTAHKKRDSFATIALKRVENPTEFGIVITREDGSIERFLEKPTWGQVFSDTINTNIYVLEPEIFDLIPPAEAVDFSEHVFPRVLDRNDVLVGHVVDGYWEDVGTIEAYRRVHQDVVDGRVALEIPGFEVQDGVWVGEGAEISPDAVITGPAIVGENSRVAAGARIGPYTVLGDDVVVRSEAELVHTIVHDHAYIGSSVRLQGTVVGRSSDLRLGVRTDPGVVIGDDCFVGEHAVIGPDVRIFPNKTIEDGAVVTTSLVFESRAARTLFGRRGVRGLANVDVSAEMAVRLAMAYGSTLKKGSIVTTGRDTSRTARALKRAVMAGLNLTGINVMDLELAPLPLTRFQVRSERAQGGIALRLDPDDPDVVELRFFDAHGGDIDEGMQRRIERQMSRGDFRRAFGGDVGDIWFPPRAIEYYTAALERSVEASHVRERNFKVVLDYSHGAVSQLMPNVLAKVGADVLTVNPFAATEQATAAAASMHERAEHVGDLVRGSGSDFGLVIAPDGEVATMIDDQGRTLSHPRALLALSVLLAERKPGVRIAVPISTSAHLDRLVSERGGTVVHTQLSHASLLEAARTENVALAADGAGGYAWPDFLPALDATATLVHILDVLAASPRTLSHVVDEVPEPAVVHDVVDTPWDRKGAVMRSLVESANRDEVVLVDGVKITVGDGWVLVVPDPEGPSTHVWAEGPSEEAARRLAAVYVGRVAEQSL
jgi:mannose-1-phosphate guanylyltransferase/phosphomannomutase